MRKVRTRFAPSPTGRLHIGNARTALFNWLFARHRGGGFVVRIEDTDTARSEAHLEKTILDDLLWLGLSWDEGPDKDGPCGPYRQSQRLELYEEQAGRLLEKGLAYRCRCSRERLEALKAEQAAKGVPPRYDNRCRTLDVKDEPGSGHVLRFAVPERTVSFNDGVHGEVSFDASVMGDFVIIGSDAVPSYNFAVVVDDALMEISHVLRGDDHLSNTPRQLLLFSALGFAPPEYYHLPLVLSPEKRPLGKRDAGASLRGVREGGFLPEAVLNTIVRLGWSPGADGLLSLDEMAKGFDGGRLSLSRSPSVFDLDRLKSYNKDAIGRLSGAVLLGLADIPAGDGHTIEAAEAVKSNASTLKEFRKLIAPFISVGVEPDAQAQEALASKGAKEVLKALKTAVEHEANFDEDAYNRIMEEVKSSTGAKGRGLFMPVRAALTGRTTGIELLNIFKLLGRERIAARLDKLIK